MRICKLCGKIYKMGGTRYLLRGNYNPTNWSKKQPNLQWLHIPGKAGRIRACVKCIKQSKKSAKK